MKIKDKDNVEIRRKNDQKTCNVSEMLNFFTRIHEPWTKSNLE